MNASAPLSLYSIRNPSFKVPIHEVISEKLEKIADLEAKVEETGNFSIFMGLFSLINLISRSISGINFFQGVKIGVKTEELTVNLN